MAQRVMNEQEKRALQHLTCDFVETLDPKYHVIDFLYSKEQLTHLEYEELLGITNRATQCRDLLGIVRRKCSMDVFLSSLCLNNGYTFLADKIKEVLRQLELEQVTNGRCTRPRKRRRTSQRDVDEDEYEVKEEDGTSSNKNICPMCKCPARINTMTKKKRILTKMQQHLKFLCMEGNSTKHETFLGQLASKWKNDADVQFVILDARARNMRVSSPDVSGDTDYFKEMASLIPFTSDPTSSSMIFLARKASVFDVKGRAKDGLTVLGYAKTHADRVVPCRDTGLVIYMEINLLLKEYELEPTEDMKNQIIERIKEAIEVHFSQEEDDVKEDCSRMLYVKMACFYLGIGLMGNKIAGFRTTVRDRKAAECVLDRVEATWQNMDARRKMFFYLAKAVLSQETGQMERALHFGEIAKQMGEIGQFKRELQNIDPLTRDLAIENDRMISMKGEDIIQEFHKLSNDGETVRDIPQP
ncbi:uncharacterized protein LOC124135748 [Haliotis rufescens]|uniref:uncharacterized protein LOC124135748 n=1 Tax=Haliotis rufescens TaxID=6454 RepID=UPI00201F909D|nr:uncharacterized protein LOC124135748 [Haliotis rufescens]XP_046357231.2 uncharacterized protein LOC124135748 [Haliotis rufescens]